MKKKTLLAIFGVVAALGVCFAFLPASSSRAKANDPRASLPTPTSEPPSLASENQPSWSRVVKPVITGFVSSTLAKENTPARLPDAIQPLMNRLTELNNQKRKCLLTLEELEMQKKETIAQLQLTIQEKQDELLKQERNLGFLGKDLNASEGVRTVGYEAATSSIKNKSLEQKLDKIMERLEKMEHRLNQAEHKEGDDSHQSRKSPIPIPPIGKIEPIAYPEK